MINKFFIAFMIFMVPVILYTQDLSSPEIKQQAETQLQTMTPQEIDAKIKESGMTQSEAQAKAKELGIDLNSYLKGYKAPGTGGTSVPSAPSLTPAQTTPAAGTEKKAAPAKEEQSNEPIIKKIAPRGPVDAELFGQSFFKSGNANFTPSPSFSEKEYVIGGGDVLKISMWGTTEMTSEYTVDKDGRIIVPTVGPIFIAGFSFEDAKKKIQLTMSKSYSGLIESPPKIFLDVSLSKLRPIRVFMMGEVEQPGGYFVNNFGNVFNSLFVVGGPKVSGSMRDIRVIRNNRVIAKVDLYDYIIGNTKTNDLRINDNDIIFVPLVGKVATIHGQLLRTGKFELLPGENLKKLVEYAGGFKSNIYKERIQVDRIIPMNERVKGGAERKVFDVEFSDIATGKKDYTLEDGDIITVFSILDTRVNIVVVNGAVARPGVFQIEKLQTIKDLLAAADGLLPIAYRKQAELMRTRPDNTLEVVTINLEKVMANDPKHNLSLKQLDRLRVYSIYELNAPMTVTIGGHVKFPGEYPYADSLSLNKILFSAGGLGDSVFRANTFLERGYISRLNPDLLSRYLITFNVADVVDFPTTKDLVVAPGDEIRIYSRAEMLSGRGNVSIEGQVKRPGTYRLETNLTLSELVYQHVGLADTNYRKTIFLERADLLREMPDRQTTRIVQFNLGELYNEKKGDTLLLPNDRIIVYAMNAVELAQYRVQIFGRVKKPGEYQLSKNMTLIDLLLQAGGYTADGWSVQAEIVRAGNKDLGEDSLVHVLFNELPDLLSESSAKLDMINTSSAAKFFLRNLDRIFVRPNPDFYEPRSVTISGEAKFPGVYSLSKRMERLSDLLTRAGGLTADGYLRGTKLVRDGITLRMNAERAYEDPEGDDDIILQSGDQIAVPFKPNTVRVTGEVQNAGLYGYVDGENAEFYLSRAGGLTDSSDFVLITYPEGYIIRSNAGWFSGSPDIPDGSVIHVTKVPPPPPPDPIAANGKTFFEDWKDILALLSSTITVMVLAKAL
ncbi:MAG: SLBB domain-containing protein [Bacteriovoracaceae bacterium]